MVYSCSSNKYSISMQGQQTTHRRRQTKWKGESGLMSTVLLPPLSVYSLISLSVSSCVLASPAGPSCYHGDESRHRLSAVISCMLPTGIFLDSPLVIICVLSFHRKSHTHSISLSLWALHSPLSDLCLSVVSSSSSLDPPLPVSPLSILSSRSVQPQVTNLLLQKATATRSHYRRRGWSYNQYAPPDGPLSHSLSR